LSSADFLGGPDGSDFFGFESSIFWARPGVADSAITSAAIINFMARSRFGGVLLGA
jgi:hypothetical protein